MKYRYSTIGTDWGNDREMGVKEDTNCWLHFTALSFKHLLSEIQLCFSIKALNQYYEF